MDAASRTDRGSFADARKRKNTCSGANVGGRMHMGTVIDTVRLFRLFAVTSDVPHDEDKGIQGIFDLDKRDAVGAKRSRHHGSRGARLTELARVFVVDNKGNVARL